METPRSEHNSRSGRSTVRTNLDRWKQDSVAFICDVLIDPETGKPFELYSAQERFLREALTLTKDGHLPFPEMLFGAPKKTGKTATGAMAVIYVIVCLGGPYAEAFCLSNDFEQAQGRVFQAITRIIEASPLLRDSAKITQSKITFTSTGATITAIASDYASAAGANPTLTVFDELWAYSSERSQRLWDEMVPVPTRKVSGRLTVTYAGFSGESELLERLYKRGIGGEQIGPDLYKSDGLLCYWTHRGPAPWQDNKWHARMRLALRPNAYLRLIENRWVTSETTFVEAAWWDACVDAGLRPVLGADHRLPVWIGVDASTKRDSTAIAVCTWDVGFKRVRLVRHYIFQPTAREPLDFESTVESTLVELNRVFDVREIRYDPYQLVAVAQCLERAGLKMVEFPQTTGNLTEASSNLFEAIKGANLRVYPDDALRLAISRSVAIETPRGWRIAKEKASHKIDVVVALAMAALAAVKGGDDYEGLQEIYRRANEANARSKLSSVKAHLVGCAPSSTPNVPSAESRCRRTLSSFSRAGSSFAVRRVRGDDAPGLTPAAGSKP